MAWSGIAKVGSMTEWPPWHSDKSEISRLGVPTFVAPGPDNPMGSRALFLLGGKEPCSGFTAQPAGIYRRVDLVRLHPDDQRGRDRPVQPG